MITADIFPRLVNSHRVGLRRDIDNHLGLVTIIVHCRSRGVVEGISIVVGAKTAGSAHGDEAGRVVREVLAKTDDTRSAEDAEDFALMLIEFCVRLAARLPRKVRHD